MLTPAWLARLALQGQSWWTASRWCRSSLFGRATAHALERSGGRCRWRTTAHLALLHLPLGFSLTLHLLPGCFSTLLPSALSLSLGFGVLLLLLLGGALGLLGFTSGSLFLLTTEAPLFLCTATLRSLLLAHIAAALLHLLLEFTLGGAAALFKV